MHKARIRTLQAMVAGTCIGTSAVGAVVNGEFEAVHQAGRIRNVNRRRILEILHSARALDSALKSFVRHHGCQVPGKLAPNALGPYFHALEKHTVAGLGKLSSVDRAHFQKVIVSKRNAFLHEAGTFPASDLEVDVLLSEMHSCLSIVVAL